MGSHIFLIKKRRRRDLLGFKTMKSEQNFPTWK
jgi:hypothetical protein